MFWQLIAGAALIVFGGLVVGLSLFTPQNFDLRQRAALVDPGKGPADAVTKTCGNARPADRIAHTDARCRVPLHAACGSSYPDGSPILCQEGLECESGRCVEPQPASVCPGGWTQQRPACPENQEVGTINPSSGVFCHQCQNKKSTSTPPPASNPTPPQLTSGAVCETLSGCICAEGPDRGKRMTFGQRCSITLKQQLTCYDIETKCSSLQIATFPYKDTCEKLYKNGGSRKLWSDQDACELAYLKEQTALGSIGGPDARYPLRPVPPTPTPPVTAVESIGSRLAEKANEITQPTPTPTKMPAVALDAARSALAPVTTRLSEALQQPTTCYEVQESMQTPCKKIDLTLEDKVTCTPENHRFSTQESCEVAFNSHNNNRPCWTYDEVDGQRICSVFVDTSAYDCLQRGWFLYEVSCQRELNQTQSKSAVNCCSKDRDMVPYRATSAISCHAAGGTVLPSDEIFCGLDTCYQYRDGRCQRAEMYGCGVLPNLFATETACLLAPRCYFFESTTDEQDRRLLTPKDDLASRINCSDPGVYTSQIERDREIEMLIRHDPSLQIPACYWFEIIPGTDLNFVPKEAARFTGADCIRDNLTQVPLYENGEPMLGVDRQQLTYQINRRGYVSAFDRDQALSIALNEIAYYKGEVEVYEPPAFASQDAIPWDRNQPTGSIAIGEACSTSQECIGGFRSQYVVCAAEPGETQKVCQAINGPIRPYEGAELQCMCDNSSGTNILCSDQTLCCQLPKFDLYNQTNSCRGISLEQSLAQPQNQASQVAMNMNQLVSGCQPEIPLNADEHTNISAQSVNQCRGVINDNQYYSRSNQNESRELVLCAAGVSYALEASGYQLTEVRHGVGGLSSEFNAYNAYFDINDLSSPALAAGSLLTPGNVFFTEFVTSCNNTGEQRIGHVGIITSSEFLGTVSDEQQQEIGQEYQITVGSVNTTLPNATFTVKVAHGTIESISDARVSSCAYFSATGVGATSMLPRSQ